MKKTERIYQLFGARVLVLRTEAGLTQAELAERVSLSRGSIANIEGGNQRVLLLDVLRFARALRVKPEGLMRPIFRAR